MGITGRVVIAGGSGFLGISLASSLAEDGADVVILSRTRPVDGPWRHAPWDGRTVGDWAGEVDGAAGLVNLAGRTVDCIKTPDRRDEILRSRVESTRALGAAVAAASTPPPAWVQMSTAHIYGDPLVLCTETSAFGEGLAPFVGRAWESAFAESLREGQRGVVLRTSFVIGRDRGAGAGAMGRLRTLVRFRIGGRVGSGRQGMSWIHEADMNALFQRGLTDPTMTGAYIASAPNPVSQAEFMRTLRRGLGVRIGLPSTAAMVRVGAPLVMRTDPALALYGRYVVSERLREDGFVFRYPELGEAVADLAG